MTSQPPPPPNYHVVTIRLDDYRDKIARLDDQLKSATFQVNLALAGLLVGILCTFINVLLGVAIAAPAVLALFTQAPKQSNLKQQRDELQEELDALRKSFFETPAEDNPANPLPPAAE